MKLEIPVYDLSQRLGKGKIFKDLVCKIARVSVGMFEQYMARNLENPDPPKSEDLFGNCEIQLQCKSKSSL